MERKKKKVHGPKHLNTVDLGQPYGMFRPVEIGRAKLALKNRKQSIGVGEFS